MTNEAKHVALKMRLISRNDAADMLGCSIQTVSNWVECGAIKSHRIGNKLYIDKQSVEKLLDTASDVVEMKQKLNGLEKQLKEEIRQKEAEILDLRKDNHLSVQKRFLLRVIDGLISMAEDQLSEKDAQIAADILRGKSTIEISKGRGCTPESVRQSWCRIEPILLERFDQTALLEKNQALRKEKQVLDEEKQALHDENDKLNKKIKELEKDIKRATYHRGSLASPDGADTSRLMISENLALHNENARLRREIELLKAELTEDEHSRTLYSTPFATDISELGFTHRIVVALSELGCKTLGDVVQCDAMTIQMYRKLGRSALLSIQSRLRDMGLKLGMDLKNMSDEEFNAHVERLKKTHRGQALL